MLKLSILEFFLIVIPECFVFIMGINFLSNKFLSKKSIIIISLLLSIEIYFVRMLPIHFGVHIFINIIFSIALCVNIGKISIKKAVSYNMIMIIILSMSEAISIFGLTRVLKINKSSVRLTPATKVVHFIPAIILFVFNIFIINKYINRKK